jgi:GNAT superfamily N-acetyltransferase
MDVVPLGEEHLEDAAQLACSRYEGLREQVVSLPSRYARVSTVLPLLRDIAAARPGVAAVRNGRLVGFLSAWLLPSFRGKRSVFSPEWANGTELEDSQRIYEQMYGHLAAAWVGDGCFTHLISLLANDRQGIDCWHWLGFGMIAADAVRNLHPLRGSEPDVHIRCAGLQDLAQLQALDQAMFRYMAAAPTFLVHDVVRDRAYYEKWLRAPNKAVWLAAQGAETVAYMGLGPASDDACTIIRDDGTASISRAFTKEEVRGQGIATALLNRSLQWAREAGYERCAVDFEPMNPLATRFWLRYFEPVCYSLVRHVDERVARS